jgi:hypothetical protein
LATFNYINAIWKNGPGVVSDAPGWVVETIEHALPAWMSAHERELIGVHLDTESGLTLAILVSPWALGSQSMLEDARHGSFVHVIASDHPDCQSLSLDQARELFESVYSAPVSDSAVRQQRSFMLLDFPYHRDLATDLFASKDLAEGGFGVESSAPPSGVEAELADPTSPEAPVEVAESPVAGGEAPPSLSLLLGYRAPEAPSQAWDGLPFEQGLSYKEMVARLTYPLQAAPKLEPEPAPGASLDAAAVAAEEGGELDLGDFEAAPILERRSPGAARIAWLPIPVAAGLAVAGFLVAGVMALRLGESVTAKQSQAELEAPAEEVRGYTAPVAFSEPERADLGGELDRHREAGVTSEIAAPELGPEMAPAVIEAGPVEVMVEELKPSLPVIEEVDASVSELAVVERESEAAPEGPSTQLASIQVEEPEFVREPAPAPREETTVPKPVQEHTAESQLEASSPMPGTSVAMLPSAVVQEPSATLEELAPLSVAAEIELVAAETEASSDAAEFDPGGVVTEALAEASSETAAEESAESDRDEMLEASATGAESEVEAVMSEPERRSEDDPRQGRRKRERKRVLKQIQSYR